ncbi:cytosolic endo-beta-N-acetylglucosaminidase-like [Dendronephthya gigantea]|uniref:cytosolic endo-beta-N-acetylglucosaminidase-like n=1 Tax=Dendronephthya gigantea TaxID=151771 RepID=UPI00106C27F6|nr:cytosolic endo-beta-N-acetylglucosaminidase-like [Dendronephthya gigantea]
MAANTEIQNSVPSNVVVVFSTLAILILCYLFWKWQRQRNNQTDGKNKPSFISRSDMLKNRLKKFDLLRGGINTEEATPVEPDDELTDEFIGNTLEKPVSNSSDVPDTESKTENLQLTSSESCGVVQTTINNKPANSRKRVTLSVSETDDKSFPETQPLTSLEELFAWREGFDGLNVSSVPLHSVTTERQPKTIVCHDMKGGYVQDRFVQGYPSTESYRIYHWQYIDIFIYFSHNFITIPPPCWTNAAHRHGVQVLGTFITEWQDGAARCAKIFDDESSYKRVADQMVLIAKYYEFEGWLLNIENPIQPAQMNNLIDFVKYLTAEMHKVKPESLIIWYDSVMYKGDLKWQNMLNSENRVFFDVSDGIFLNYGWNQRDLALSRVAAGNDRQYDVYVGVDVFGRGVFGGGGWNTNKATHVIKESNLSIALFAPGWVYEKFESTFKVSQDKFWASIASDCNTRCLSPCLPFVTSFCQGYGEKWWNNGMVSFNHAWTHLSAQEIQPTYINQIYSLGKTNGVLITSAGHQILHAYRGGGCLELQGSTTSTPTASKAVVRLFKTDIVLPSTVMISFTIKLEDKDSLDVALQLHVDKKPNYLMLCPVQGKDLQDQDLEMDNLNEALMQRYGVPRSSQIDMERFTSVSVGQEHYRSFAPVSGDHHGRLAELCCIEEETSSLWYTRYYLLAEKDLKGSRIKEIRLVLMNKTSSDAIEVNSSTPFQLYLGEIKIIDAVSLRKPLPTVTSLKCLESKIKTRTLNANTISITLTLSWNYDSSNSEPWQRFEIYHLTADNSKVLLGMAYSLSYVVCDLALPRSQKEAKLTVQAVSCSQRKRALAECPVITVYWS